MATCNPNSLTAAATCFRCVPHREKRTLDLYLLNSAAGSFTIAQLATGAAQFRPIQDKAALAAKCYALAVANGITATGAVLEGLAKCWQCIPKSERENVEAYLNASNLGGSTDPKVLLRNIATYKGLYPVAEQVELYLLASLAMLTRAQMQAGAACLMCLSITRLQEIYLYLLCLGIFANTVPLGSTYSGATPEFDLTVLPNTTYVITWGVNELSMTLCGTSVTNTGAGTQVVVNTGACTLMQFFGTFAGTKVTAVVRVVPVASQVPTPTGFTWVISGANAVATWDAPPPGVLNTELWTSTDNSTFTLAATVARPGTTASVAAPGNGVTLYAKIRFTAKGFPGPGVFTSTLNVSGTAMVVVNNWVSRVAVNGGTAPTAATQAAAMTFVTTLVNANIWSKMIHVNILAFESLMTAKTPLLVGGGNDPWTLVGGPPTGTSILAQGLSINQSGSSSAWNTGVQASVAFAASLTSMGVSFIKSASAGGTVYDSGGRDVNGNTIELHSRSGSAPTLGWGQAWQAVAAMNPSLGTPAGVGFNSFSRINSNRIDYYFADSLTPCASVGNSVAADAGTASVAAIYLSHRDDAGTMDVTRKSSDTYSFFAIHKGLTSAETATLFSASQTLRTAMGGGSV